MKSPRIGDIVTAWWSGKGLYALAFNTKNVAIAGGSPPRRALLILHIKNRAGTTHELTVLQPNCDIAIIMSYNIVQFRMTEGT